MRNNSIPLEVIHKELDLLQGCIDRMDQNSFMIKGWSITLFSILMAIEIGEGYNLISRVISGIAILLFWYLDAFYLRLEKQYRKIYEWVIVERLNDSEDKLYDLNIGHYSNICDVGEVTRIMFNKTVWPWYILPIIICVVNIMCSCIGG